MQLHPFFPNMAQLSTSLSLTSTNDLILLITNPRLFTLYTPLLIHSATCQMELHDNVNPQQNTKLNFNNFTETRKLTEKPDIVWRCQVRVVHLRARICVAAPHQKPRPHQPNLKPQTQPFSALKYLTGTPTKLHLSSQCLPLIFTYSQLTWLSACFPLALHTLTLLTACRVRISHQTILAPTNI